MIYFFDKNMELKKLVVSSNVYNPTHQQVKNGMILAQLEFDIDYAFMFIDKVEYFGYFYNEVFYLHRIKTVEPDFVDNIMTVAGNHIFFDDMIGYNYIKDVRPFNRDANYVLQDTIGAVTRWEIVMTDATASLSSSFYYLTPMEALEQIVKDYQVEYEPRILFDGKKINGYQLHVANKLGNQDAKRVRFGDKVLQLKYDIDYSDISTAVIGRGKGEEVGDGYGRRIEFTDINFSRNGVVSPVGKNYMEDPRITDLYGYDDGTPKYEIVIFEDIENVNQLAEATYNYYVENAKPKMLFETEVTDIGIKHIGDSLLIVKPENNLAFKVRVEKIDVNLHNPEVPTMELGDYEYFQESKVERKTRENNEKVQGELSDRIAQLKREANERFDKIVEQWKSEYEQVLIDVAAEVEAMRVTMTEEFETAQREFEEEFNQSVADAKKHADDVADAKANQVQGNLDSFKGEHEQLVGELQGNIIDINGELDDARADVSGILGRLTGVDGSISGIKGSLTEIEGTLTNTKTQLESQITDARTELEKSISDARAEIEGLEVGGRNRFAKSKVVLSNNLRYDDQLDLYYNVGLSRSFSIFRLDSLGLELNQKYILAYEIKSNNPELKLRTNTYINGSVSSVDNNSPELIEGEWVKVYTKPFLYHTENTASVHIYFNQDLESSRDIEIRNVQINRGTILQDYQEAPEDTDNKITNINQTITNIEGELSSKVEQSEVDTLKGTVTNQGTLLTQTMVEVSSKAEKSVVDTLTGRVANTETSVTQNSEEIAKRLTKSDYQEGKQDTDAQITQWSNLSTETAEGLEQTISRVSTAEGKISKAQADIIVNANEIATKVSSTEFDALEGIVSDNSTAITQNTQSINLKANQSELDQVTNRVASAEAEISVQAGEIELRATKSELDEVEGRVTATEASLTVLDDEISSVVGRVSDNETNISSVVQDVRSITSTVATIEGDVATQGSQISQANDVISSKVWMDDVANIGANLIPQSANAWERGGLWIESGTETAPNGSLRMKKGITIKPSTEYTLSDDSKYVSAVREIHIHQYSPTGAHITYRTIPRGGEVTFTTWSNADTIRVALVPIEGFSVLPHYIEHLDGRIKVKLEEGSVATPMVNAISQLQQTADSLAFKVAELTNINGEEILTQSDISIESDRILIGSQQISSNTLASLISVSPSSIDLITDKMNLTGNLNVKGQIESISMSAIKADFAEVFAGTADIQFILAKHLASDSIQARHLYVSNAMAEKLIANTVMAREIKTLSIDAVEANIGSLRTQILTSNVIKSSHIAGGTALIDKIFSSNAMFERMMSKNAFVTTLNTVTIDTDQITIRRPDGARLINNGMLQASFDVQIRPNYGGSAVTFGGLNYRTQSSHWQTFEHFYTDFKGSKLLVSWAYSLTDDSASAVELGEFRVRGFGSNNPIGTAVSNKWVSKGETGYHNQIIDLGVPDYSTIQAYLEFRRSPSGQSQYNTVNVRVLRVSLIE